MLRRLLAVSFLLVLSAAAAARAADPAVGHHRPVPDDQLPGADRARRRDDDDRPVGAQFQTAAADADARRCREIAQGWKATILGGGQPVGAVAGRARQRGAAAIAARTAGRHRARRLPLHRRGQERAARPEAADHRDDRRGGAGQAQADHQFPGSARHRDDLVQVQGVGHQRQRPRRDDQFQRRRAEELPGHLHRGLWPPAAHQHPDRGRQVEGHRGLADASRATPRPATTSSRCTPRPRRRAPICRSA